MQLKNKALKTIEKRSQEYGSFRDNCNFAMKLFFLNLCNINILEAEEKDVHVIRYFLFMLCAKLARLHYNTQHEDSKIDLIGYCKIYKKTCNYRFILKGLSVEDVGISKIDNHKKLIDMINNELQNEV